VSVGITGAKGTVGTVLRKGLPRELDLRAFDLPELDVRDFDAVACALRGLGAVVHLAWNTSVDNYLSGRSDPGNVLMAANVYRAALELGISRLVMASSVHADDFYSCPPGQLLTVAREPVPTSPYGAGKVVVESLGRHYAARGLEVVCLRLGAITPRDRRPTDQWGKRVWLRHGDLSDLVRRSLSVAEPLEPRFQVVNAVSHHRGRVHDTSNALGWVPRGYPVWRSPRSLR
jgi:nucleoside-diphosphate-sugar epimerase